MKKMKKNSDMKKYLEQHNVYESVPLGINVRAVCRYAEEKQIPLDKIPIGDLARIRKS